VGFLERDFEHDHLAEKATGQKWPTKYTVSPAVVLFIDTGRIYIKGYLYPILYPKISKKDISYPFLEQDFLRI
jgi:hypothetical protein